MNGPNNKPTAIDLFCGAGGSTLGFKMANFNVVFAVDINEVALSAYQMNHPEVETFLMDIMELTAKDLPKADVILGSTPCQEFSIANIKRIYDMDLTHHFLKIIHDYKPKYWMLENVPGIAPYLHGVKYNILCAADYGVPQKRYRCIAGNYPMPRHTHSEHGNQTLDNGNLKPWVKFGEIAHSDGGRIISKKAIAGAFRRAQKMWAHGHSFNFRFVDNTDVLPTVLSTEPAGIRTSSIIVWDDGKLRRLSWLETIRSQSFPDNYIFNGTQAQRYHQIGDAVPPLLAKAIADAIRGDMP
jgi:DNA (cytosine-5)-methyltransferase 1